MVQLSARRALVAALVLLISGLAAGTAVAHDGGPRWWRGHKGNPHNNGNNGNGRPATTTTGDGDDQGEGRPVTTTSPVTTTAPTMTATTTTTPPSPATTTTTTTATTDGAADAAVPAAAPQLGRSVALATTSGTVLVRTPGAGAAAPLTAAAQALPTGTRVDTRRGEVTLTSAVDAHGATQTGRFSGGVFEVRQAARGRYTQLVLLGGHWAACRKTKAIAKPAYVGARAQAAYVGARAIAAKKKKPIRRLWGSDDHGRFQTRGSGSVATVRGTRWLTEDSCAGTRTTVKQGAVDVRSKRTGKTVRVTAGHSFLAKR